VTPDPSTVGTATPAPFLFELTMWFSVASVIAWAWLSFVQRRNRVVTIVEDDPMDPDEEPAEEKGEGEPAPKA
jgi:hypothetical protein